MSQTKTVTPQEIALLQTMIKNLAREMKKYTIDEQNMRAYAEKYLQEKEAEKERKANEKAEKELEKARRNYKLTSVEIEEFLDDLFSGFDVFVGSKEDKFRRLRWGTYDMNDFLQDSHSDLIDTYRIKIFSLRKELWNSLRSLLETNVQ